MKIVSFQVQHRMRPVISGTLMPHFYKDLKDAPSVSEYPKIQGIETSLYFISHTVHEDKLSEDRTSYRNSFEAEYAVGLCKYLIQQGYEPSQITLLVCYAQQLFDVKDLLKRSARCA